MGSPRPTARGPDRRRAIAEALRDCILKTGYAETSLTEIALAASMSPSHVLYYFSGKPAVLAYLFEAMCDGLRDGVLRTESLSPEARIEALAELFFGPGGSTREELSVFLEIFGVAVHDTDIREMKSTWDAEVRASLAALFAATPRPPGLSQADAAEEALAALVGLATGSYFSDDLQFVRARRLYRSTLRRLAGFPPYPEAPPAPSQENAS